MGISYKNLIKRAKKGSLEAKEELSRRKYNDTKPRGLYRMTWKFSFQRTVGIFIILLGISVITVVLNISYNSNKGVQNLLELTNESNNNTSLGEYQGIDRDQKVVIKKGVSQISIPSLKILAPIVEGTDSYSLSVSAGHFTDTVGMGKKGNYCIAGHRSSIYNCIFNNIDKIKLADAMYFTNSKGKQYIYYVVDKYVVEPTQMEVLEQDTEYKDCTIVTCTDNGARRLIIKGRILTKNELEELKNSLGLNITKEYIDKLDEIGYINFDYRMFDDNLGNDTVWHTFGVDEVDEVDFSQRNMFLLSSVPPEIIKSHSHVGNTIKVYTYIPNNKRRKIIKDNTKVDAGFIKIKYKKGLKRLE